MREILKQYFGYDDFRPLQEEIVTTVLKKNDAFVLMPTGGGKSLCYQLPALKFPGLTLVISPLIALMKDQVDSLKACGIPAEFVNSTLSPEEIDEIYKEASAGKIKILYAAPERFANRKFLGLLKSVEISLIAIDEAHCISEWGHDFRPDYRNLRVLRQMFPQVPLIALTATATAKVREDIVEQLDLQKAKFFISSFNRENLCLSVVEKKNAFQKLLRLLDKYRGASVVVYCFSRRETEEIAEKLDANGFKARAYHAGLSGEKRKEIQELFIKDRIDIIAATIAFGMGIDKPDVRLVVHYTYPKTLEGYYQEIGRAGRDGLQSECVMFYTYADTRKHEFFLDQMQDRKLKTHAEEKLGKMLDYAELATCRKKYLLKYFGEDFESESCGSCDICLAEKTMFDATIVVQKILSAVVRTENRFGKNHIIEVLRGKHSRKVAANGHDRLSVFGIVNDFSAGELSQIINHLAGLGYIKKSVGKYPTLSIAKKGVDFLKNGEVLQIPRPQADFEAETEKGELDYNVQLYEKLRALRRELAEKANVPPFIIFGDASLREMAYYLPQDKDSFARISGVGAKKLEDLSQPFLSVIVRFTKENGLVPADISRKTFTMAAKTRQPKTFLITKELVVKKIPLEEIARRQNLKIGTIINHLYHLAESGEKLDISYIDFPEDKLREIGSAFAQCGAERLRPVFDYLGEKYSYDEIRLAGALLKLNDNHQN